MINAYLFELIVSLSIPLFMYVIGPLVVFLCVYNSKKRKSSAQKSINSEAKILSINLSDEPRNTVATNNNINQIPNKQKEYSGSGGLNALLFIGSLLIVIGSCSLLMSAVTDLIKMVILLVMTFLFYVGGYFIRQNKKLIPAGNAFLCTSLAIIPFLGFAFSAFSGITPQLSWLLTSLIGTIAYIFAAMIIKNRVVAVFSVGFIVSLLCSAPANLNMSILWNYIAVIVASIIANLVSNCLKDKLPNIYRDILSFTARILAILVAIATVFGVFALKSFDYQIIFCLCFMQFGISYLFSKEYIDEILARIVTVPFLLSVFWNIFPAESSSFALIAGIICLLEVLYSLFSGICRPDKKYDEIPFVVTFMILSMLCPIFAIGDKISIITAQNVALIITVSNFVLSLAFSYTWSDNKWIIASAIFSSILPFFVNISTMQGADAFLLIYIIEFIIYSLYFLLWKKRNKTAELVCLIIFSAVIVITRFCCSNVSNLATREHMLNIAAFLVPALAWFIFGHNTKDEKKVEVAIYFVSFFIGSILNTLLSQCNGLLCTETYHHDTMRSFIIYCNEIIVPMFIIGQYKKKYYFRVIATSLLTFIGLIIYLVTSFTSAPDDLFYRLLFLIEEITILIISATEKRKALFWITMPTIIIMTFALTSGMVYLWLIFLGLAIIAFVIWRLSKSQDTQKSIKSQ